MPCILSYFKCCAQNNVLLFNFGLRKDAVSHPGLWNDAIMMIQVPRTEGRIILDHRVTQSCVSYSRILVMIPDFGT